MTDATGFHGLSRLAELEVPAPTVQDLRSRVGARQRRRTARLVAAAVACLLVAVGLAATLRGTSGNEDSVRTAGRPVLSVPLDRAVTVGWVPDGYSLRLDVRRNLPQQRTFDRVLTYTAGGIGLPEVGPDGRTGQDTSIVVQVLNREPAALALVLAYPGPGEASVRSDGRTVARSLGPTLAVTVTGPASGVDLEGVVESVEVHDAPCLTEAGVSSVGRCAAGFVYAPPDFGGSVDPDATSSTDTTQPAVGE